MMKVISFIILLEFLCVCVTDIQQKGLIALQILIDPQHLQSKTMCNDVTDIIRAAILNFPNSLPVQKEVGRFEDFVQDFNSFPTK
jgi:hypothetical protein